MRQSSPRYETPASVGATDWLINEGPVTITNNAYIAQKLTGDISANRWKITRPIVNAVNGTIGGPVGPLVAPDCRPPQAVRLRAIQPVDYQHTEHPDRRHWIPCCPPAATSSR